jgi:hypothetical protein
VNKQSLDKALGLVVNKEKPTYEGYNPVKPEEFKDKPKVDSIKLS